jgi:putative AdoMet-dependent methyltransferase
MSPERTSEMFDAWAEDYDFYIRYGKESFPFLGYDNVLNRIVKLADPQTGNKILDVGIGTGNLAQKFTKFDCEIWGIDYSSKMLDESKKKLPNIKLLLVDISSEWPSELLVGFDRIVSAYTLHHFRVDEKVAIIQKMAKELLNTDGKIIIGDISFPTYEAHSNAQSKLESVWDDDEFYWIADEFTSKMSEKNLNVDYEQVSIYGGIYIIK